MHVKMWPTTHVMLQVLHQIPFLHLWQTQPISHCSKDAYFSYVCARTHTEPCLIPGLCWHWLLIKCFRIRMKEYIRSETFSFFFLSMKALCAFRFRICTGLHSNINMYHNTIPSAQSRVAREPWNWRSSAWILSHYPVKSHPISLIPCIKQCR